jgi:hypothetical protein
MLRVASSRKFASQALTSVGSGNWVGANGDFGSGVCASARASRHPEEQHGVPIQSPEQNAPPQHTLPPDAPFTRHPEGQVSTHCPPLHWLSPVQAPPRHGQPTVPFGHADLRHQSPKLGSPSTTYSAHSPSPAAPTQAQSASVLHGAAWQRPNAQ